MAGSMANAPLLIPEIAGHRDRLHQSACRDREGRQIARRRSPKSAARDTSGGLRNLTICGVQICVWRLSPYPQR